MRKLIPAVAVLALGACMDSEVGTRSGVGFGSYELYNQQQAYIERGAISAQPAPVTVAAAEPAAAMPASALPPAIEVAAVSAPSPAPAPAIEVASATPIISEPLSATSEVAMAVTTPAVASTVATNNIAAFALSTNHPVGQPMFQRTGARLRSAQRACAAFASDSLAQEAFLEAGGPQRDRLGLDPDGDGYACAWDPTAFRLARQD